MRLGMTLCCCLFSLAVLAAPTATIDIAADGATLSTSYYLPVGTGPFPVMVGRTPYGKFTLDGEAGKWVSYGYAFVAQDLRGTGASTDPTSPLFSTDGWGTKQDAVVTVDWILAQPWCNGKIGTLGFSAPGAASMLAGAASANLTTQIIENAPSTFYGQWAYQGGVSRRELSGNSWDATGVWRSTPTYTSFWAAHDSNAHAGDITTPTLFMTGWFDIFQAGGIEGFMSRHYDGGVGALGTQQLVIVPEDHNGGSGELTFPNASLSPGRTTLRRTFNEPHMLGTGTGLGYTIKYFTMGASGETGAPGNEWRTANDWPPFPTTHRPYHLQSAGVISTAVPPATDDSLTYTYDPTNPVGTVGGNNLTLSAGPRDQRSVSGRPDVLAFQTAPLTAPLEVTGQVRVRLFVSSDATDTDFTAKLVDIYPDGREILFNDGIQRVKFRNGFETPDPLPVGTVGELEIDLWHTSLVFNTGHRIGLQISSSNYPRFEVNPNNGNDLPVYAGAAIDPSSVVSAQNTVHFGGTYPSALLLPVSSDYDADADGLDEAAEVALGTDPNNPDTDGDGLSDGDEVNIHGTNPLNPDTDGDGYSDDLEISLGSDPNDPTTALPIGAGALVIIAAAGALLAVRGSRRG